jgi:hypothetical protein
VNHLPLLFTNLFNERLFSLTAGFYPFMSYISFGDPQRLLRQPRFLLLKNSNFFMNVFPIPFFLPALPTFRFGAAKLHILFSFTKYFFCIQKNISLSHSAFLQPTQKTGGQR